MKLVLSQGDVGPQGINGNPGEKVRNIGLKGQMRDKGDVGPPGEKGSKGEIGPSGVDGAVGPPGPKGEPGDAGSLARVEMNYHFPPLGGTQVSPSPPPTHYIIKVYWHTV